MSRFGWLPLVALAMALIAGSQSAADDSQAAWIALAAGGHIALIRHGNAPPGYGGDPPGFRFDDCKTQRNLDEKGRAQGKALGEAFRSHGVRVDRIVSSPVCRCMDTATLMAVGQVEISGPSVRTGSNRSGTAWRVERDGVQLARRGDARADQSWVYHRAAHRDRAGSGRSRGPQADAGQRERRPRRGQDRAAAIRTDSSCSSVVARSGRSPRYS